MNKKYIILFFLILGFNNAFNQKSKQAESSQQKIFLPSESGWVTFIEYWNWNEDNIEKYAGKYEHIHPAENEKGEYNGDGYNFTTEIKFNSGDMLVLGYGKIEGEFQGIDTLSSRKIVGNKFGNNEIFVNLKYKTRNQEVKTGKGLLELNANIKIESFSEYVSQSAFHKDILNENLNFDLFGKKVDFITIDKEKLSQLYPNITKDNIYDNCCPEVATYYVNKVIVMGSGHSDATFYFLGNNLFQINVQTEWDDETEKEVEKLVSRFKLRKTESKYEKELGRDMITEYYENENYLIQVLYYRFRVYSIVNEILKAEVKKRYPAFEQDY